MKDRGENAKNAIDPTTGCMGCASGVGAGPNNIFGNKYGQNLAAVQMAREKRMAAMEVCLGSNEMNYNFMLAFCLQSCFNSLENYFQFFSFHQSYLLLVYTNSF